MRLRRSLWKSKDSPSCARDFFDIGKARHQPSAVANIWAYLLLHRDGVFDVSVSVKQSIGNRLYRSCLSFVRKCPDKVGCRTVRTPRCVVTSTVRLAVWRSIPQLRASVCASNSFPDCVERRMDMPDVRVRVNEVISRVGVVCCNESNGRSTTSNEILLETTEHRHCDGGGALTRSPGSNRFFISASSCSSAKVTSYGS